MEGFSEVTKAVVVYIDVHYKEQFTLDDMGAALGYSKSYLCTTFKKETGSTINDYLNLVRISHFTEYYSFVDDDIAYLCRQCGFASPNHFNKTFKKFLGTTPKQFKQIRYQHFNSTFWESKINTRAGTIQNLRSILDRASTPTAQRDLLSSSSKPATGQK
jgi:AraC-like DNA-binding protein